MANWSSIRFNEFVDSDMFRDIIQSFYDIYWRPPSVTEFFKLGFVKERLKKTYGEAYRNKIEEIGYNPKCGLWTCVLNDVENNEELFVGGVNEVADELEVNSGTLYKFMYINMPIKYNNRYYNISKRKFDIEIWSKHLDSKFKINIQNFDGEYFKPLY